MNTTEESVVFAMDGADTGLYPFLPYILQDIWEFGASPVEVIALLEKQFNNHKGLRLLDLGCGKGPVSVQAARSFGCHCHGIDAVQEFIAEARLKAKEFGVDHLCTFETADIREAVSNCRGYDVVVLGAIGPVLGTMTETLNLVSQCLSDKGVVVIDDGFTDDEQVLEKDKRLMTYNELLHQVADAGMKIIAMRVMPSQMIRESNALIFSKLQQRCLQLSEMYPEKKYLFQDYIVRQEEENEVLEQKIVNATMLIGRC